MIAFEELERGEVAERLVGPDGVVFELPGAQRWRELSDASSHGGAGIELVAVGPVRAFDAPVELGATRREDEELEAPVTAGGLELPHELTTPVDLDRTNAEGHAIEDHV